MTALEKIDILEYISIFSVLNHKDIINIFPENSINYLKQYMDSNSDIRIFFFNLLSVDQIKVIDYIVSLNSSAYYSDVTIKIEDKFLLK
jgi:hypothetical protein